jgi:hypothetical protein
MSGAGGDIFEPPPGGVAALDGAEVRGLVEPEVRAPPRGVLATSGPLGGGVWTDSHPPADGKLFERSSWETVAAAGGHDSVVDDGHPGEWRGHEIDTDGDAQSGRELPGRFEHVEEPFPSLPRRPP